MPENKTLGKSLPRVDAMEKITGKATYASDVYLPGMLMCKLLTSTESHARIVKLDVSEAEALPGVRAVITGQDYPDVRFGSGALMDRRIMARDEVFYIGEPLAAVAADDEVTAREAVELIQVEYQALPVVVDPLQAIRDDAAPVHVDLESFEGYGFAGGATTAPFWTPTGVMWSKPSRTRTTPLKRRTSRSPSTRAFWNPWPASQMSKATDD